MADDGGDELRALRQVIGACRIQATYLDLPALDYILGKAEASLAARLERDPPEEPPAPAPSAPRDRIVRH